MESLHGVFFPKTASVFLIFQNKIKTMQQNETFDKNLPLVHVFVWILHCKSSKNKPKTKLQFKIILCFVAFKSRHISEILILRPLEGAL